MHQIVSEIGGRNWEFPHSRSVGLCQIRHQPPGSWASRLGLLDMNKLVFAGVAVVALGLGGAYFFLDQGQTVSDITAPAIEQADIVAEPSDVTEQAGITVEALSEDTQQALDAAQDAVMKAAEDAGEQVQEQLDQAADQATEAVDAAKNALTDGVSNALDGLVAPSGN